MMTTSESASTPWYAVQTRSNYEASSAAILANKGYEVFYPIWQTGATERPLFPCYLFCRAPSDKVASIATTPGVIRLLGRPGKPEAVPDDEIASVRCMMQTGLKIRAENSIKIGGRVRILRGALTGIEGDVIEAVGGTRFAVSICILQHFLSINLEPSWLESINRQEIAYAVAS